MTGLGVYETPRWAIDAMLTRVTMLGNTILEPCAGSGAIVQAVRARDPGAHITAVEIRPEEEDALHCAGADEIHIADFLTWEAPRCFTTVITNPPFHRAQEILERCFALRPMREAQIIMLLRLGFLESKKRHGFWCKHPVHRLLVLSQRPSLVGGRTDATAYAWFVWDGSRHQSIEWLAPESDFKAGV